MRRDPALADNCLLPRAFQAAAGDRVYNALRNGFPTADQQVGAALKGWRGDVVAAAAAAAAAVAAAGECLMTDQPRLQVRNVETFVLYMSDSSYYLSVKPKASSISPTQVEQFGGPPPAATGASLADLAAGARAIVDIFVSRGYATKVQRFAKDAQHVFMLNARLAKHCGRESEATFASCGFATKVTASAGASDALHLRRCSVFL